MQRANGLDFHEWTPAQPKRNTKYFLDVWFFYFGSVHIPSCDAVSRADVVQRALRLLTTTIANVLCVHSELRTCPVHTLDGGDGLKLKCLLTMAVYAIVEYNCQSKQSNPETNVNRISIKISCVFIITLFRFLSLFSKILKSHYIFIKRQCKVLLQ